MRDEHKTNSQYTNSLSFFHAKPVKGRSPRNKDFRGWRIADLIYLDNIHTALNLPPLVVALEV